MSRLLVAAAVLLLLAACSDDRDPNWPAMHLSAPATNTLAMSPARSTPGPVTDELPVRP
jgi:hypothetical protein